MICATLFAATTRGELRPADPVIDIRMAPTRPCDSCFVVMMAMGAILVATTQFPPPLPQEWSG